MSFASLGLSEALLRAIADQGHGTPTPIQSKAIPVILAGRDVLAAAQTGTGKTGAFGVPLLERLKSGRASSGLPRALILTPTRELAAQVAASLRAYSRHLSLKIEAVFGGVGIHPQIRALRGGVDILVATPGRLIDHLEQKTVRLSGIEVLVLDEADRMLDMGFIPAVRRILSVLPQRRQNLLFSATFPTEVRTLAASFMHNPEVIEVAPRNATAERVTQHVHPVSREYKRALLSHLVSSRNWGQTLVFTRTKHGADRLARQLEQDGISTAAIHGDKSQGARTRALSEFKAGRVRVLVATDIAARGIDIEQLPQVVNYELPHVPEDYIHRIGRTGRASASGVAVSLVCPEERQQLKDIERLLKRSIPSSVVEDFSPPAIVQRPAQPQPAAHRRHNHQAQKKHRAHRNSGAAGGRSSGNRRHWAS
ncbi:MAG TPA: DEAD/DEAH box helicase [Gammaproteobacteria bacterium]|nr:DEAD/DEAH box helicase [Gammaproteobacteria bacterium]